MKALLQRTIFTSTGKRHFYVHSALMLCSVFMYTSLQAQSLVQSTNISTITSLTTDQFRSISEFPEGLVPAWTPTGADNAAFTVAVAAWQSRASLDDFSAFENFISQNQTSPWRMTALVNLGLCEEREGYLAEAIVNFRDAWNEGKNLTTSDGSLWAQCAFSNLLRLNVALGQVAESQSLMSESAQHSFYGNAARIITLMQKPVADMGLAPKSPAFQCGPTSIGIVAAALKMTNSFAVAMAGHHAVADTNGFNLEQLAQMSQQYGVPLQMAYRQPGSAVLTPSVMHLKLNHYSALTKSMNGSYLLQDTSLNTRLWMSQNAIDSEASGYFLVPTGALPTGWRSVTANEATNVWGSGNSPNVDTNSPCTKSSEGCSSCGGMPVASIDLHQCSLLLKDTPFSYTPPFGPAFTFSFNLDSGDLSQPFFATYSNMGAQCFLNWMAYIEYTPWGQPNNGALNIIDGVTLHARGGGIEYFYAYFPQAYYATPSNPFQISPSAQIAFTPGQYTGSLLSTNATNSFPYFYGSTNYYEFKTIPYGTPGSTNFYRMLPDGTVETYAPNTPPATNAIIARAFLQRIIDPKGNAINFTYNSNNCITSVLNASGNGVTFTYGNTSNVTEITQIAQVTSGSQPIVRSASFAYTTNGLLFASTDVLGLTTTFNYNPFSTLLSMTTPYGTTSFSSGTSGGDNRWVQITDPLGGTERAESWPMGAPNVPQGDPLGVPNMPIPITDSTSQYLQYRTTYYWSKKAMMDAPGNYNAAHSYQFDHSSINGNLNLNSVGNSLESEKAPYESRIWYNYPGQIYGNIAEGSSATPTAIGRIVQNASGALVSQVTLKTYNAQNNVTSVTDPTGRVTTYNYDTNGIDVLSVVQGSDTITTTTYDTNHLPLTVTDDAGQTTYYGYNTNGQIVYVTDPQGNSTIYEYDGNNNPYLIYDAAGGATYYGYDSLNRVTNETDSEGYTTTYAYDAFDRVTTTTFPDGTTEQTTYNLLDVASTTDRQGRISHNFYDGLRHLIVSQDPMGHTTLYNYCKCGALNSMTDPDGNTTTFTYDPAGRMTAKTHADGKGSTFTYDVSGRSSTITDALGQIKTFHYNLDDTLSSITYSASLNWTPSVYMAWDPIYPRLSSVIDGTGTTAFSYYPTGVLGGGQVSSITTPLTTISYSYDSLGRVANRQINGAANSVTVGYDNLGRITSVQNPLGSFGYTYINSTGLLKSATNSIGLNTTLGYWPLSGGGTGNGDERLASITNSYGSTVKSQFGYQYDIAGHITQWSQLQPGISTNPQIWANQYDTADRLTGTAITASSGGSNIPVKSDYFIYDPAGNRLSRQENSGSVSALTSGTFNNLNQLQSLSGGSGLLTIQGITSKNALVTVNSNYATSLWGTNFLGNIITTNGANTFTVIAQDENTNKVTNRFALTVTNLATNSSYAYDANGNLLNDGSRTYKWDAENRLLQVSIGTNTYAFGYDYNNRRVFEKLNGTLIKQSVWEGNGLTEERNISNSVMKQFFSQGEVQSGTNYYYCVDQLGSIRELLDNGGTIHAEYSYDPYGNVTKVSGDRDATFQYAGYYAHLGSGLNFAFRRAYDPMTGRWLSRDPIGEDGGINIYEYAGNDPIGNNDPTGLICLKRIDVTFSTARRVDDQEGYKKSGKQYVGVMLTRDCLGKTESYSVFSGGNIDHHPHIRMGSDTSIPWGDFHVETTMNGIGFLIDHPEPPNRSSIEIHPAGATTGCIAVAASFDRFVKDMADTAKVPTARIPISVNYHMTDGNPPPVGNGN